MVVEGTPQPFSEPEQAGLQPPCMAPPSFIPQLLLKPKFSGVEKIKTIGSTYMAAAGLSIPSGHENQVLSNLVASPSSRK